MPSNFCCSLRDLIFSSNSLRDRPASYTAGKIPHIREYFVKKMRYNLLKLLLLTLLLSSTRLSAQTMTEDFLPARDNTLYERPLGDLSNGAGDFLFFGLTGMNANNVLRRAVLAYDLSSIPPGSIITDAGLTINVDMVAPGASAFDANLHRLTSDWGEGTSDAPGFEGGGTSATTDDATWLHTFFDTQFWTTPGGDFEPLASATTSLNNSTGLFTFSGAQLIADIQSMVDTPGDNFGWVIIGDENTMMNARRIGSRENPEPGSQPLLSVTYEAGPPPPPPPPPLPTARAVPAMSLWSLTILAVLLVIPGVMIRLRQD